MDHNTTRKASEESTITSHDRFNTIVAGNLNIAAVKEGDTDDQRVWKCYISNTQLNVNAGGSESKIVKTDQPPGEFTIYMRNHRGHWGTSSPISETPGPAILVSPGIPTFRKRTYFCSCSKPGSPVGWKLTTLPCIQTYTLLCQLWGDRL